jgi:hypothetical protein
MLGHEVQLLRSGLTIDKRKIPWRSDTTIPVPSLKE